MAAATVPDLATHLFGLTGMTVERAPYAVKLLQTLIDFVTTMAIYRVVPDDEIVELFAPILVSASDEFVKRAAVFFLEQVDKYGVVLMMNVSLSAAQGEKMKDAFKAKLKPQVEDLLASSDLVLTDFWFERVMKIAQDLFAAAKGGKLLEAKTLNFIDSIRRCLPAASPQSSGS